MTAEEAIEEIKTNYVLTNGTVAGKPVFESIGLAIDALEKQIPKKPNRYCHLRLCPVCGSEYITRNLGTYKYPKIYPMSYCNNCGQAIDFSEDN